MVSPRLPFVLREYFDRKCSMAGGGGLDTGEPNRKPAMSFERMKQQGRFRAVFANEFESIGEHYNNCRIHPMGGSCPQFIHVFLSRSHVI